MKRKPFLALNLFCAALAIGAFFAGSMVPKYRMSGSGVDDTEVGNTSPDRPTATGRSRPTSLSPGEGGTLGRPVQGRTNAADNSALREKYTKRVVSLSSAEFGLLAKTDLDEAKRVFALVEDQKTRREFGSLIVSALIARDLDAAIYFAAPGSFWLASGELATAVYKQRGTDGLLAWIDEVELGDKESDQFTYKEMATCAALEFVASDNPERAREWVVANAGQPHVGGYTLQRIAGAVDPEPSLQIKWLAELPITGNEQTEAVGGIFAGYIRSDLDAAGQWLAEQELMPMHDKAIEYFAAAAAKVDLEAAQAWAEQIGDEALRKETLERLERRSQ